MGIVSFATKLFQQKKPGHTGHALTMTTQREPSVESFAVGATSRLADSETQSKDLRKQSNICLGQPQDETVRIHATGAKRSADADSERWDLISPIGLKAVAETCREGANRYGDFNWESGFAAHDLLNHSLRHQYLFLGGDRSEPHLAHAAWNLLAAIHSIELWPHLNEGHLRGPGCTPPAKPPAA